MKRTLLALLLALATITGCATNPVTGKKELKLVSDSQAIAMGQQQYAPARQMQGGDYVLDPELTAYVKEVGARVASQSEVQLPYEFTVLNNSVPNAWAMPGGKIAINRGLLTELNSEAELAAVLGHEVVHAAAGHGASAMSRGMLLQGLLIAVQISQMDNEYGQYVVGGAQLGAQLISTKYGRDKELESDLYGMQYMSAAGYDPDAAVDLQQTFVRLSQGSGRQSDWLSGLFSSHPPSTQRVATNRNTATTLPDGGDYGKERYQQMVAGIKRAKPAYEAYNKGVKAIQEGKFKQAENFAQEAIRLDAREGKFYGLLGDTHLHRRNFSRAVQYYDQALEKNSNFFQTYLTRGMATLELGNWQSAEADLKTSIQMLPTATAFHRLGMIALQTGRKQEAVAYLEQAAQSDSDVGRAAAGTLAKLEISTQPEKYIQSQLGVGKNGNLVVRLQNSASVPLRNVKLVIVQYDQSGRVVQQEPMLVREVIAAKKIRDLQTRIGPISNQAQLQSLRVVIQGAEVAE